MATASFNATPNYATGSAVAWFKQLHDALISVGLVQTSDSGQLDLSTAGPAKNATALAVYGYTVYRFNDTYQATSPVFIKAVWQNATTNANPIVSFSVGEGSDGAGNLTGKTLALNGGTTGANTLATTSVSYTNYVSFSNGSLNVVLFPAYIPGNTMGPVRQLFNVDRLRDLNGNLVSGVAGYLLHGGSNSTAVSRLEGFFCASQSASTIGAISQTTFFLPNPFALTSLSSGGDIPFVSRYFMDPEARTTMGLLAMAIGEVNTGVTFTASRFGTSRTFLSIASNLGTGTFSNASTGGMGFAIIWE